MTVARRKYHRHPHPHTVEINAEGWAEPLTLNTHDISAGGLFARTDTPVAINTEIELSLPVPGSGPLAVSGRVIHIISYERSQKEGVTAPA